MIGKYLGNEHEDKKNGEKLDLKEWNCLYVKNLPQQTNGNDCGVFACKYAEWISRGKTIIKFNQVIKFCFLGY